MSMAIKAQSCTNLSKNRCRNQLKQVKKTLIKREAITSRSNVCQVDMKSLCSESGNMLSNSVNLIKTLDNQITFLDYGDDTLFCGSVLSDDKGKLKLNQLGTNMSMCKNWFEILNRSDLFSSSKSLMGIVQSNSPVLTTGYLHGINTNFAPFKLKETALSSLFTSSTDLKCLGEELC
jgi:hypothetical protein